MRFLYVVLAFLAVLLCHSCSGPSGEPGGGARASDRAVVLIVADGLRADRVGSYGADGGLTPALDELAAGAVRFDWAFAQTPERDSSLASLMTGLYATTHGVIAGDDRLSDDAQTLAELLAGSGFETAAFVESAEGWDDRGLAQGFGTFDAGPEALGRGLAWLESRAAGDAFVVLGLPPVDAVAGDRATGPANENRGSSSEPASGTETELASGDEGLESYERRVAVLDERLGAVLEAAAGLMDRATIVVLSTTGIDLGEHEATGRTTVYTPVTRVPLLIRSPRFTAPRTVDKIVEVIDVMPTLLELVGASAPPAVQGRSLVPLIEGAGTPPYVAFGESHERGAEYFVALGGYRMVLRGEGEREIAELYDLAADPMEVDDLAGEDERRIPVLRDHLSAWKKMTAATSLDPELRTEELDDDALEQLRSLGYIQ